MNKIFSSVLLFIFLASPVFSYQAQVENVPSEKYFETALNEINHAKNSVTLYMYLVSMDKSRNKTQPYQLLEALIGAKEHGARVEVVLDQNMDFVNGAQAGSGGSRPKNVEAYEILKSHGVAVYFDDPARYTHSKVIVIDDETVILGSTNWTKSGLSKNVESNLLVRSKELARDILKDLEKVKRLGAELKAAVNVAVPWTFTNRENLLGRMVTNNDERAMDAYLYLLKEYDGNPRAKIILNYDALAQSLGMEGMGKEGYRRQIIKALEKLEGQYRLLEFRPVHGKDALVVLRDLDDPAKLYRAPESRFFKIPDEFWKWGWSRRLSLSGKVMYFLNLSYAPISKTAPRWQASGETLSKRHFISREFVSAGTAVLRRADLIEVEYSPYTAENGQNRAPNVYFLKQLYDPAARSARLNALEEKWGAEKLDRAKTMAALVYEDSDVSGIETLLELENTYGRTVVEEAGKMIALKNPDNSKRSMGYLIDTIRGMGEKRLKQV